MGVFAGENGLLRPSFGDTMDDLSEKPCSCGSVMGEVIGFQHRTTDDTYQRYRVGWYCTECQNFDKAIGRERVVNKYC